eukprot:COSAG06_NODE_18838_length_866_cov_0.818774_2_plen_166_part_01
MTHHRLLCHLPLWLLSILPLYPNSMLRSTSYRYNVLVHVMLMRTAWRGNQSNQGKGRMLILAHQQSTHAETVDFAHAACATRPRAGAARQTKVTDLICDGDGPRKLLENTVTPALPRTGHFRPATATPWSRGGRRSEAAMAAQPSGCACADPVFSPMLNARVYDKR